MDKQELDRIEQLLQSSDDVTNDCCAVSLRRVEGIDGYAWLWVVTETETMFAQRHKVNRPETLPTREECIVNLLQFLASLEPLPSLPAPPTRDLEAHPIGKPVFIWSKPS